MQELFQYALVFSRYVLTPCYECLDPLENVIILWPAFKKPILLLFHGIWTAIPQYTAISFRSCHTSATMISCTLSFLGLYANLRCRSGGQRRCSCLANILSTPVSYTEQEVIFTAFDDRWWNVRSFSISWHIAHRHCLHFDDLLYGSTKWWQWVYCEAWVRAKFRIFKNFNSNFLS